MNPASRVTLRRIHAPSLGGLLLVVALVGESYLMSRHTAVASARPESALQPVTVVATPLAPGHAEPACSQAAFEEAEETLAKLADSMLTSQIPLSQLKSNPFRQETSSSARTTAAAAQAALRPADERAAVLKAVASLELESVIVSGTRRSCSINSTSCEEGQQINGFAIETIANGSVTLSRGIYRFVLTLPH